MKDFWTKASLEEWGNALASYGEVIARQSSKALPGLDRWYREELSTAISSRKPKHITLDELAQLTEWKMARGIWRPRNLTLVRGNAPEHVVKASTAAFKRIPEGTGPIADLAKLGGVGPATASAAAAAAAPEHYPFFDELVANQIPKLGSVEYTVGYYARYATAIREQAIKLGNGWTPVMVEQALWANAGGKAGVKT